MIKGLLTVIFDVFDVIINILLRFLDLGIQIFWLLLSFAVIFWLFILIICGCSAIIHGSLILGSICIITVIIVLFMFLTNL